MRNTIDLSTLLNDAASFHAKALLGIAFRVWIRGAIGVFGTCLALFVCRLVLFVLTESRSKMNSLAIDLGRKYALKNDPY